MNHDEYDLFAHREATNGSSQPPDEQDVVNEYQHVGHPLTYLADHVGFSPLASCFLG